MSMTQFESSVKTIYASQERIFETLADLNNLEKIADRIPKEKVKEFSFDTDSCNITVDPVGEVTLRIIEREPCKTIKFTAEKSPIPLFLWIQLVSSTEGVTHMKLTIKAELNPFIKGMVKKPLEEGIEKLATVLATITY